MPLARYSVHVFCNECGEQHPMGIDELPLDLDEDLFGPISVGDVYGGRALPEHVAMLMDNFVRCPVTGSLSRQEDNHQVFVVRIR
jgi:hypothetical protein